MRFRTPPVVWAMLIATLVNVVIFDFIVLRAENAGLREVVIAAAIGIAAGVAVLYLFDRYIHRL